jgi:hypothetical protein
LFFAFTFVVASASAQSALSKSECTAIASKLQSITLKEVAGSYVKVNEVRIRNRKVEVRASAELAYYPMRPESVEHIYDSVRTALPEKFRSYPIKIYSEGKLIEELIPQYYNPVHTTHTFTYSDVTPLITRLSGISQPTNGLQNKHIALWQSHGRYFKNEAGEWRWQRSRLWETVEDLYTQSYVIPYILPMLERAGATVLLPRERSMRTEEVILDNDKGISPTIYHEASSDTKWQSAGMGFAHLHSTYPAGHNPFTDGTARMIATTHDANNTASATWGGTIPTSGLYSLYISYTTQHNSISNALYTVHDSGGDHTFAINQKMGGAMWICLGEFYFTAGKHERLVTLTNYSTEQGVVVADAVKIGGGMGNIRRGVDTEAIQVEEHTSGYPRFTEGARYWLQWSGFPASVYSPKDNTDDYKEDYMSRAHWVNYLMGGSEHLRDSLGKRIPIDLTLAIHSDAGVRDNDDVVGTLGIYCTRDNKGKFPLNTSRLRSRDLTDIIMTQIIDDVRALHEPDWKRRGMWDRAYYEARIPSCPTMLLELLSHQNYGDMSYGLDPTFRFDVSRAIYKGILRYLASQYGVDYVVQPLPVHSFSAIMSGNTAHLSWQPTADPLEPTAAPEYYILYTRIDGGGFDTGRRIDGTHTFVMQEPDHIYSYRITAVNSGGESFDSEILSTCYTSNAKGNILVVNGFTRVSAPERISTDTTAGFIHTYDGGVPYIEDASFIGEQRIFDRSLARSDNDMKALGTSYHDCESITMAGNTFDYPALHGAAIVRAGYSFSSASSSAVESGHTSLDHIDAIDLILGKQRTTTIGRSATQRHKAMPAALQSALREYTSKGGALLISGAYTLADLTTHGDIDFAHEVLYADCGGYTTCAHRAATPISLSTKRKTRSCLIGEVELNTEPSQRYYMLESAEVINPTAESHTILCYDNGSSAAIAHRGTHRVIVMGFPIEVITSDAARNRTIAKSLDYLLTTDKHSDKTTQPKRKRRRD